MRRCFYCFSLALGLLLAAHSVRADDIITFTVLPPDVSGAAGTTVGWGYSITNDSSTDYLDLSDIDASVFQYGDPDSSPFLFSFPGLAPGATFTQSYDPLDDLGLFQLTWDSDAPAGFTNTGTFGLYGAFCDPSDPFCVEDGDVQGSDLAFSAYSATVSPSGAVTVPEPSTLLLLCAALGLLRSCLLYGNRRGSPLRGYILAGQRARPVILHNMSKRDIRPTLKEAGSLHRYE
jgi:hypothetical protein